LDSTLEEDASSPLLLEDDVVSGDLASFSKSDSSPNTAELLVENLENSSATVLISANARSKKLPFVDEPSITCAVMHGNTRTRDIKERK
jgi:hypothetical protein